jgi:hypothetical protein
LKPWKHFGHWELLESAPALRPISPIPETVSCPSKEQRRNPSHFLIGTTAHTDPHSGALWPARHQQCGSSRPPPQPGLPSGPHHIRKIRPCEEFWGLLVGGDVRQLLQAEELGKIYDVLLHQAQLLLQDGTVQADALLWGRQEGTGMK